MMTVVPTIDVEGVHGARPFEQFVRGKFAGATRGWGVFRLAEIFRRFGVSATFFVDCYEYTLWGEGELEDVCCRLLQLEQDVQLHTHPAWRDDFHDPAWLRSLKRAKSFFPQHLDLMAKLTLSQQIEVLMRGVELLTKWTGTRPVAHRSGGYSIDANTVRALNAASIAVDSSMHIGHNNSRVRWATNRLVARDGLIELPITVMHNTLARAVSHRRPAAFAKLLGTDLDCSRLRDLLAYIDHGLSLNVGIMNLFMHSYSLLKFDPYFQNIRPDPRQVHKLESLLSSVLPRSDVRLMSCRQLLDEFRVRPLSFSGDEAIPCVAAPVKMLRMACTKLKHVVVDSAVRLIDPIRYRQAS